MRRRSLRIAGMALYGCRSARIRLQEIRHPGELIVVARLDIGAVPVELHFQPDLGDTAGDRLETFLDIQRAVDDGVYAPVLPLAFFRAVIRDGARLAISHRFQP